MATLSLFTFSLSIPDEIASGWTLNSVILAGPVEESPVDPRMPGSQASQPFQSNIIATLEQVDDGETPESFLEKQLDGLRQANVNRREAAQPEKVTLADGTEGLLTEHVITGPAGDQVQQMQLVAIKKGVAHTLIATQLEGAPFERMRARFREILLSFR